MKKLLLLFIVCISAAATVKSQKATIVWTQLSYVPSTVLYSVYCLNYDTVVAVGYNGYIIRTTDSGIHWDSISSNTSNTLLKVIFVNDSTGYAVGENGTILKTNDIGQSWTNIGINTNLHFFSLSFINKDTGWVAGGEGNLFYTFGNKGILLKTTNGGTNWLIDSMYDKTIASVFFIDKDTGYIALNINTYTIVGCISILKKTTDGGNLFSTIKQDSLYPVGYYTDIYFINSKIGYFVSSAPPDYNKDGIYKTIDFGNTWSKILTQWSIKSSFILDSCILYLYYSDMPGSGAFGRDSCLNVNLTCPFFTGMYLLNKDSGFCVGSNIYKRGLITNINKIKDYNVIKIFPNPFNNKTILRFYREINVLDINIYILNSLGQEIINKCSIINNQFEIDLTNYPNGLYYLIIRDKSKIIQSKKLIKL